MTLVCERSTGRHCEWPAIPAGSVGRLMAKPTIYGPGGDPSFEPVLADIDEHQALGHLRAWHCPKARCRIHPAYTIDLHESDHAISRLDGSSPFGHTHKRSALGGEVRPNGLDDWPEYAGATEPVYVIRSEGSDDAT